MHFADVLDLFDDHLATASKPFESESGSAFGSLATNTKPLVMEILRFSALFLDHCQRKHAYGSVDVRMTLVVALHHHCELARGVRQMSSYQA